MAPLPCLSTHLYLFSALLSATTSQFVVVVWCTFSSTAAEFPSSSCSLPSPFSSSDGRSWPDGLLCACFCIIRRRIDTIATKPAPMLFFVVTRSRAYSRVYLFFSSCVSLSRFFLLILPTHTHSRSLLFELFSNTNFYLFNSRLVPSL